MLANVFTKTFRDRWRSMAIAAVGVVLRLLLAMSVYANFDFTFYDDLPEAFRSLMNIPDNADAGSLAIGVLCGLYGAFTLGGLAISMGSASIAGEEKAGTIGILLGNPKSRTNILISKMGEVKLVDFGLAVADDMTRFTQENALVGTLAFMDPGLLRGREIDAAADVRSEWSVRDRALALRDRGVRRYGIAGLFEAARYARTHSLGRDDEGFALNNSYRSRLARRLMADHPELDGMFETRELRA